MLLREEELRRLGEKVPARVTADHALLSIHHLRETCTRLSNNAIAQNMCTERCEVTLSVAFENRLGNATVVATDDDALRELVRRAEENANLAPPDPEYLAPLGPQEYLPVRAYAEATAEATPEAMARISQAIIEPARAAGMKASGTVETSAEARVVMTSRGLFAYHPRTEAQVGCTIHATDSSGWARGAAVDIGDLQAGRLATVAIDQARQGAAPREISPGTYTVLLMPAAAAHLATCLVMMAEARRTLEGLTFLSDRVGSKLAGDEITLYSDPQDPRAPFAPFDAVGIPQRRMVWVDRGTFSQMWWDRWTARQKGVEPVPIPGSLSMVGGETTLEELVGRIERGVLVTHVWYLRAIKIDQALCTGMTRDGTFLIEDGVIRGGIRNLRFNDSCLGMLQRTLAIGRPEPCAGGFFPGVFPPLVVADWNFTGVTDF